MTEPQDVGEPTGFEVAIVGMAGRFPGARSVDEFWTNVRDGVESIRTFTVEELEEDGVPAELLADERYVRRGSVLDDIDRFDAAFFGVTPREAEVMDPQHRFFLECAWTALEDAGYDPDRPPGPIGVYGGTSTNTYLLENLLKTRDAAEGMPALFGNQTDYLTTRVSYKLNLQGPSVDVQTSCSSSLVAVHLACQGLISGECDLALAGGVTITVPHKRGYLFAEQGIYSPDGHCRAFSSKAQGTVGGNGVAVVALRRLADALEDGDEIRAVIKGSAINNDGSDKIGYAAPSVDGQRKVIEGALAMAEVPAESVTYVETHGTGTSLGDPIEVAALTQAFRASTEGELPNQNCAIGSVKTNIGHLDVAAGVTGVVKASMALSHAQLPPSLNCDEPDPKIDFPSTPFRVNTALAPWTANGPRRAGVSSFGIGGTNAHVVLEEAPASPDPRPANRAHQLLVLSARTPAALDASAANLAAHLRAHPDAPLADLAWTLQIGRKDHDHRRIVAGPDAATLAQRLESGEGVRSDLQELAERAVVFLFPGQGSQYVGMGRELYLSEEVFRAEVDRCAELLEPHLGLDLRDVIFSDEEGAGARLQETRLTQPALFTIEYALARLWRSWGVEPTAMLGHSIGEYVAAALAGVFELEDALALVAARGALMQGLPAGTMLAVPLPAAELEPLLGEDLSLAAVNEPASSVASGPDGAIAALEERLRERGVEGRRLHTSHAFHSSMMDPILDAFTDQVRAAGPRAPRIPMLSNLTGTWLTDAEATDPAYWAKHLRNAVRFAAGVEELLADPARMFLEVGPGNTLTTLSNRIARAAGTELEGAAPFVTSMRHPREERPDGEVLLEAVGRLWLGRVHVDWDALHGGARRRRRLPTYPFEGRRFWVEPGPQAAAEVMDLGKKPRVADWFYQPSWGRAPLLGAPTTLPKTVLLFDEGADAGDELASLLRDAGSRVWTVTPGEAFSAAEAAADHRFTVRAHDADDHRSLLEALPAAPDAVVHLGGLGDDGFGGLLHLAQAADGRGALEILAVTRGVRDVTGAEELHPRRAAVLGLCQAIAQELPNIGARTVDVDELRAPDLLRELALGSEPAAAWRNGRRWVPAPTPVAVREPAILRDGGHFLVTGGLGSIGLEVAACLASASSGARIVLTGRSAFPGRDTWDGGHDGDTGKRIAKIREIEAGGAEILVLSADVAVKADMERVISTAEERFGALHGVVHAAGAEKAMARLQDTDLATCEAQMRPKLAGLTVLEEVLAGRDLDFVVVQSSLSSVLGALGMVGYVAAHHVVDAFVAAHNRGGDTPWTAINWDNWLSWKEPEFAHTHGPAYYMTPAEGAEAFRRVLGLPAGTQLIHSTGDLGARLRQWVVDDDEGATEVGEDAPRHERPDLRSDYVAPTTEAEHALVRAWGEVLGIGSIGIQDSFFELGGDSVLGLQVVAKASAAGLRITPGQIFEHPTIEGLARVAESRAPTTAQAEGEVTGSVPLTPIQHWFFGERFPDPQHFDLPMLVEVPAHADAALVANALGDVVAHHDALRLRYRLDGDTAEQFHADGAGQVEVREVDLTGLSDQEAIDAQRAAAAELRATFDLEAGPLTAAALFRRDGAPSQLFWLVHHLQVDVVAWRMLIEDLQTALRQRGGGEPVKLPAKSASFQRWSRALAEYAQGPAARAELAHWTCGPVQDARPIPTDKDTGPNVFSSAQSAVVSLDEATTRSLLQEVPPVYDTRIDEVLLAALTLALNAWTGGDTARVDLEGHGREDVLDGIDVSRTVGWFTTVYPATIRLEDRAPGAALKAAKEQVRRIPNHGIGYGILRYLTRDAEVQDAMAALPRPDVNFLYLGQFDALSESGSIHHLQEVTGAPCSADAPRAHLLEIVGYVSGGRLQLEWSYSTNRHEPTTIDRVARSFVAELEGLVAHCKGPDAGGRTPSDFPAARVSQKNLDKLMSKLGGGKRKKGTG